MSIDGSNLLSPINPETLSSSIATQPPSHREKLTELVESCTRKCFAILGNPKPIDPERVTIPKQRVTLDSLVASCKKCMETLINALSKLLGVLKGFFQNLANIAEKEKAELEKLRSAIESEYQKLKDLFSQLFENPQKPEEIQEQAANSFMDICKKAIENLTSFEVTKNFEELKKELQKLTEDFKAINDSLKNLMNVSH